MNRIGCTRARVLFCAVLIAIMAAPALAKVPEGYGEVRLGMPKTEVVRILQGESSAFPVEDEDGRLGQIIRGDELFRYATYVFNPEGALIEIDLEMREILGRDRVLEIFNSLHGLQISPAKGTTEGDRRIEVAGNRLIIKKAPSSTTRSAEASR